MAIDARDVESNHRGMLTGRVVDASGVGVPDALVLLTCVEPKFFAESKRQPVTAQTDAQGSFRFESLSVGRWAVLASARVGRADAVVSDRVIVRLGEVGGVELVLGQLESVSSAQVVGFVRNHLGDAVVGADIRITNADASGRSSSSAGSSRGTSTDSQGRFEARELPHGPATLAVSHPDYRGIARQIVVSPGWNEVPIALEPRLAIAGSIRSTSGQPIPLAWVIAVPDLTQGQGTVLRGVGTRNDQCTQSEINHAQGEATSRGSSSLGPESRDWTTSSADGPMPLPGSLAKTQADNNGDYRLTGLNPDVYRLLARAEGYAVSTVGCTVQLDESPAVGVDIVLQIGATVVVRVTGVSHASIALAAVRGHEFRGANETVAGECRIDQVLPGDWTVSARAIDGRTIRQNIALSAGEEAVVELHFEEGYP